MKKVIKIIFVFAVILAGSHSAMAVSFSYKYEGKKLNYETNSDNTCYVSNNQNVVGNITIPDKVIYKKQEYTVVGIGSKAFYDCNGLTSMTIGDNVTSMSPDAFQYCDNLESIKIGNSVTSIGKSAFNGCRNLTSVIIGNSVKTIGDDAFYGCQRLSSITIGNSVTSIGEKAFYDCISLTSVTIPDSVISIGESAFEDCTNITSLTIGNSVKSIGEKAFYQCIRLTSVTIPDSVTSIGDFAFGRCASLNSLTLTSSIANMGQDVFPSYLYSTLKEPIMLGDRLIYNGLFYNLEDATKEAKVTGTSFSGDIIIDSIVPYNGVNYVVTTIGENAFNGVNMKSIKFPNTLKTIEKGAFESTGFGNISLPEGIEKLGYNAFARCEYLKSIHLPSTLKDVSEDFIFGGCYNLVNIEFDSQKTIDRLGKDINNLTRGARLAKVTVKGKESDMLTEIDTPLGVKGKFYWKKNAQGKKYVVNEAGKTIVPATAWNKIWFKGNVIVIQKNGKYGCYSYSGKQIVPPSYDTYIGSSYSEGRLLFGNNTATGGKYFVFSKTGALLATKVFTRSQQYSLASWLNNWVPSLITFD